MSEYDWEQTGKREWRRFYPNGRRVSVSKFLSGWDVSITYPDGHRHRGDRYYASLSSAKAAGDRLGRSGSR